MLKVRVRNFQSIEDAEIVIDGLTVVTGTNNAGKSALFRAIRGAFTNARGTDFVRLGAPYCTVEITFPDGQTLKWKKGAGVNDYVVNGRLFKKVGHGVPPEARIFGVDPIVVSDTELWPQIAAQVTGVSFLLDQPGSLIAEAVADVSRVNQLTRALKACESDRRSARNDLKVRRDEAKKLEGRRERYVGLDEAVARLEEIAANRERAERTLSAVRNLAKLSNRLHQAREAVAALQCLEEAAVLLPDEGRVQRATGAAQEVAQVRRIRNRHAEVRATVQALTGLDEAAEALPSEERVSAVQRFRQGLVASVSLARRLDEARRELARSKEAETALSTVELDDAPLRKTERLRRGLSKMRDLARRIQHARQSVGNLQREELEIQQALTAADAKVHEILGEFEDCPTCGASFS